MSDLKQLSGKNRLHSLEPGFLWEMGLAQTHGDTKYAPDNWKDGAHHKEEYIGAAMRHLLRYWAGETYDPETGLHHMAHIALSCMFLHWFDEGDGITERTCKCTYCNPAALNTEQAVVVEDKLASVESAFRRTENETGA